MRPLLALALAGLLAAGMPRAASADGDGIYGRFDSDLRLAVTAGGGAATGEHGGWSAGSSVHLRYLYAAGLLLGVHGGPWGGEVLAGGELRPLFPGLFLEDLFSGNPWIDLTVQSLGVELGLWRPLRGEPGAPRPFLGASLEAPLRLPSAPGPSVWARLEGRWWSGAGETGRPAWRLLLGLLLDVRLGGHPLSGWEPASG